MLGFIDNIQYHAPVAMINDWIADTFIFNCWKSIEWAPLVNEYMDIYHFICLAVYRESFSLEDITI